MWTEGMRDGVEVLQIWQLTGSLKPVGDQTSNGQMYNLSLGVYDNGIVVTSVCCFSTSLTSRHEIYYLTFI
jgi:hypothetical protein